MNGGGLVTNAEPPTTAAYSATNGGWNSGTGVFTPTSGNPSLTVAVGDWANVFVDGATTPVFVGRVTAAGATTLTVSTTVKSGTAPTTAGTGISVNVGGSWLGPTGAVSFPFGFVEGVNGGFVNAAGNPPRVNFKNDQTYSITAAMTHTKHGNIIFQGYTATAGDLGKATINGGTSGTSYILLTVSGLVVTLRDMIFTGNGATGTASAILLSGGGAICDRVVVHDVRGTGFDSSVFGPFIECEAYACNLGGGTNKAGFDINGGAGATYLRCISHDNAGTTTHGFQSTGGGGTDYICCIADTNGKHGFNGAGNYMRRYISCDAYNNGTGNSGDGILENSTTNLTGLLVESCNLISNARYGVEGTGANTTPMIVRNCGFFSNTSGSTSFPSGSGVEVNNSVTLASSPYSDAANGDFRISLAAAKNAGRGAFMQTAASYAGTVGYPDIGAAQHLDAGGILINPGLSGGLR